MCISHSMQLKQARTSFKHALKCIMISPLHTSLCIITCWDPLCTLRCTFHCTFWMIKFAIVNMQKSTMGEIQGLRHNMPKAECIVPYLQLLCGYKNVSPFCTVESRLRCQGCIGGALCHSSLAVGTGGDLWDPGGRRRRRRWRRGGGSAAGSRDTSHPPPIVHPSYSCSHLHQGMRVTQ